MKLKIILSIILGIFLLANVRAIPSAWGEWINGASSLTITEGENADFNVGFHTTTQPMTVTAKLYEDGNAIKTIFNKKVTSSVYTNPEGEPITVTPAMYVNAGIYELTLGVSDRQGEYAYILYLTVLPASEPANHAPVITSSPVTSVNENTAYTYDVQASDADGDTLTYSFVHYPNWLSINSATGLITGTSPSVSSNTDYSISVLVSDGEEETAQSYTLRVLDIVTDNVPVITILGSNPATVQVHGTYTDAGATATDIEDGSLTASITALGSVNTNIRGTYAIVYSVTDSDSNTVTATRTVNVVDTLAPVITLNGANPLTITQGTPYTEYGATVTDNYDIVLTIITSGSVNTNVVGTYTVTYTSTDSSGNAGTATRTVNVVAVTPSDTTAPVIVIISPTNGSTYDSKITALQVQITDAHLQSCWLKKNNGSTIQFSCTSGVIKTLNTSSKEGTNKWTVYAKDVAGNQSSETVTFKVDAEDEDSNNDFIDGTDKPDKFNDEDKVPTDDDKDEEEKFNVLTFFYMLIATISLGIILVSVLLFKKMKEKENAKVKKYTSPLY